MKAIAQRPTMNSQSFLPEDYLERKHEMRSIVISLALFFIMVLAIAAALFVTNRQWSSVKAQQEDVTQRLVIADREVEQLKELEKQKAEMIEKAEITTALIEKVPRSILLAELINRMPKELTLTELALKSKKIEDRSAKNDKSKGAKSRTAATGKTSGGSKAAKGAKPAEPAPPPRPAPARFEYRLEMVGLASTDQEVADYQQALTECPLLTKVEMVYTNDTKVDDVQMRKFRIEAMLLTTADARQIEPLHVPRLPPRPGANSARQSNVLKPAGVEQPVESSVASFDESPMGGPDGN